MVAPYTSSSAACLVTVPTPTSDNRLAVLQNEIRQEVSDNGVFDPPVDIIMADARTRLAEETKQARQMVRLLFNRVAIGLPLLPRLRRAPIFSG